MRVQLSHVAIPFPYRHLELRYVPVTLCEASIIRLFDVLQVFYSTPGLYTEAKHASQLEWSVKKDDFFPYADCPVRFMH